MQVLQTIGYILLFIVFLSLLVVVHEAGHLSAAKIFKVYCHEFSVGFGPKIFSVKRKKGETKFSLRAVPFGGFVSMYGESEQELPEGVSVPKERSLFGIKKWKRAIILVAGVTMNAVLALVMFFVSNQCFIQRQCYINEFTIQQKYDSSSTEDTPFYKAFNDAGLIKEKKDGVDPGYIFALYQGKLSGPNTVAVFTIDGVITYDDSSTKDVAVCVSSTVLQGYKKEQLRADDSLVFYEYTFDPTETDKVVLNEKALTLSSNIKDISFTIIYNRAVDDYVPVSVSLGKPIVSGVETVTIKYRSGLSFFLEEYWLTFGQSLKNTFVQFGNSSVAIFRGFATLFTQPEQASGIIGVGFITTNTLKNMGWSKFIYLWAFISVNLAIVNLFPFPGLDGWQLLVLAVEGIFHKEIPNKVKNIISIVGIVLLFTLMAVLVVKDVFTFIF